VLSFKHFVDQLPKDKQKECVLIFHCAPVDDNGTDIPEVCRNMIPNYNVIFTHHISGPFNDEQMNYLFNSIDVYINLASNEGFGLGSCEALSVGKPIVVNVTGGLQDQCGFYKRDIAPDGSGYTRKYLTAEDYIEFRSNHKQKIVDHGEWAKPVWPSNISLQGSPQTPYIFDDRCQYQDAGEALKYWYDAGSEERDRCGQLGMEFVKDKKIGMDSKEMGQRFIDSMETAFEKWKPKKKYTLEVM
jgi:glycosyltransferase involved in cell wall biosynthesis